jgi:molecular chaperone DnaJ
MAAKRDYYEVLGVSKSATEVEIKRAFRARARQYHPDVNKDDGAEMRFKEINEAYEVLSDQSKRSTYDQFGHAGVNGAGYQNYAGFDGFADIFEQFFGAGGRRTQRGPQRGSDLRYDLRVSFEEAVFGSEKVLEVPTWRACSRCSGSGAEPDSGQTVCPTCHGSGEIRRVQQSVFGQFVNVVMCDRCHGEGRIAGETCHKCSGQGRERTTRHVTVKIPPGVDNGQQIRLTGEGEAGPRGGPTGDLYVVLDVADHPLFERDGFDIHYELPITVAQAALGDEVNVPTLDGSEELKIPAGTQGGHSIRLRGRGIPFLRGSGRGDMYVVTRVMIPTRLNHEQKDLFRALAESLSSEQHEDKGFFEKVKQAFGG